MILLPHLCAARCDHLHIHRTAHHGKMIAACEVVVGDLCKIGILPTLRPPARADVERNHLVRRGKMLRPEPRRFFFSGGRQPHLKPCIVDFANHPRRAKGSIVRVNLVHDRMLIGADMIEEKREARLRVAHNALAAAQCRKCGGALVAVQIDDEVVFLLSQPTCEAQDAKEALVPPLLVDQQTLINVPIFLHDIRKDPIREEGDTRLGIVVPQRAQDGRHKHEITEMHKVDDEDVLIQTYNPSNHRNFIAVAGGASLPRPHPV